MVGWISATRGRRSHRSPRPTAGRATPPINSPSWTTSASIASASWACASEGRSSWRSSPRLPSASAPPWRSSRSVRPGIARVQGDLRRVAQGDHRRPPGSERRRLGGVWANLFASDNVVERARRAAAHDRDAVLVLQGDDVYHPKAASQQLASGAHGDDGRAVEGSCGPAGGPGRGGPIPRRPQVPTNRSDALASSSVLPVVSRLSIGAMCLGRVGERHAGPDPHARGPSAIQANRAPERSSSSSRVAM